MWSILATAAAGLAIGAMVPIGVGMPHGTTYVGEDGSQVLSGCAHHDNGGSFGVWRDNDDPGVSWIDSTVAPQSWDTSNGHVVLWCTREQLRDVGKPNGVR